MSNDCCGILRVVARDKRVISRLHDIGTYRDKEFCLSRCKSFDPVGEMTISDGCFFVQDFDVCGAWECSRFFEKPYTDNPRVTTIPDLAKRLGFGAELFSAECGFGFCEHYGCDHNGNMFAQEVSDYTEEYPKLPNGDYDFDAGPEYYYGDMDDYYGQFESAEEIYA